MSSVPRKMKQKQPGLLKQQSTKLEQKLSLLRSQVTQKKKQKSMNQTSTSSFRGTAKDEFNKTNNNQLSSQKHFQTKKSQQLIKMELVLLQKLSQIKLQGLQGKLMQKGINTISKLVNISQQQIDQWKDIAVGWRIKLKKLLKTLSTSPIINQQKPQLQQYQQKHNYSSLQQQLTTKQDNIEHIIEKRNQVKIFVPLTRQYDEEEQNYHDFDNNNDNQNGLLTVEDQEQLLIDKLMKVLQPRKPILVKHSNRISQEFIKRKQQQLNGNPNKIIGKQSQPKTITWSKSVEQLQRQFLSKSHKTYPKQTIIKEVLIEMHHNEGLVNIGGKIQSSVEVGLQRKGVGLQKKGVDRVNNETKYCWKCFKRISNNNSANLSSEGKFFCTTECLQLYNSQTDYFQQSSLQFQ